MGCEIVSYQGTATEDGEITSLLTRVFVEEGYTERSVAEKAFDPNGLRRRGEIMLARSWAGELLGMIICVRPTSPAHQIAELDEAEIHLLAVSPPGRGQGIASDLITACQRRAASLGYFKVALSTQPTMNTAHYVYEKLGYRRNPSRDWGRVGGKRYLVYTKLLHNKQ